VIFFGLLFLIFQSVFAWATVPMDFIDGSFASLSSYLSSVLPKGVLSSLISEGVVPGIGGIMIFIPQIAILFAFISLLEESGYMARVVFLMDKVMRPALHAQFPPSWQRVLLIIGKRGQSLFSSPH
jgi:ferrous iron transport protein B